MNQDNRVYIREGIEKKRARIEILTTPTGKERIQALADADGKTTTDFILDKALNPNVEHRLTALERGLKERFAELHDEIIIMESQMLEILGFSDEQRARIIKGQVMPIAEGDL